MARIQCNLFSYSLEHGVDIEVMMIKKQNADYVGNNCKDEVALCRATSSSHLLSNVSQTRVCWPRA